MNTFFVSECKHDGQWLKLKTNDPDSFRFIKDFRVGAYDVTKHRNKRSNDANAYCWRLCDEIADKIRITKEEVYRDAVRDVGRYTELTMPTDEADRVIRTWQRQGLGWPAVIESQNSLRTTVFAYYGSSTYDTKEMSRLIDYLAQEAKNLGIETLSEREQSLLLVDWGRRNEKHTCQ